MTGLLSSIINFMKFRKENIEVNMLSQIIQTLKKPLFLSILDFLEHYQLMLFMEN